MASLQVRNIDALNRAFAKAGADFRDDRKRALTRIATPVQRDAQTMARARIRRIGPVWDDMRIGVLQDSVYIAPVARGTRIRSRKRPRFGDLLMERAMKPALARNRERVGREFDALLAKMEQRFNG